MNNLAQNTDQAVKDRLITARVQLLLKNGFFGNLAAYNYYTTDGDRHN